MAQMYLRPSDKQILAAHAGTLQNIQTFEPVKVFGDWDSIMDKFLLMVDCLISLLCNPTAK